VSVEQDDISELGEAAAAEGKPEPQAQPQQRPKGRGLAVFSLLLALVALAAAGFIYYQFVYLTPLAPVTQRVTALESALAGRADELRQLRQAQSASLEALAQQQQDRLEAAEQAMIGALNEASSQGPPAPRDWKLAEVEYLLRIANHRVLMERDVDSALRLFSAADAILLELDDFALHAVRAALADEILALRSLRGNDVQGIYLRLEAVKGRLAALPLELPEYFVPEPASGSRDEEPDFLDVLSSELGKFLKVRRFDGATKPLLAPEEAVYLELNLRLMLERSQLAALRRQQLVYEQSLGSAQEWLHEYLDAEAPVVQELVAEIEALLEVQLDQALPDVSGSLSALLAVLRGDS